jgi:predicted ATPase
MICNLRLDGFKRFRSHAFPLRALTILAGMNGTGKTSVIHALLLAREGSRQKQGIVKLNGPFGLELGSYEDVLNYETPDRFEIGLFADVDRSETFTFTGAQSDRFAAVHRKYNSGGAVLSEEPRGFQYLSAERLGPRIHQSSAALPLTLLEVGCQGEHTAQLLDDLGATIVPDARFGAQADDRTPLLKDQTEAWLSRVTRPIQLDTESFPAIGAFSIRFRTGEEWVKPTNMGFGVTYALPVIVAGLTAPPGAMLVVENPEAHLHPAGQSQMGVYLATMAAAGLQILVETHSDHVLNGVRRAIGELGVLNAGDAMIHYFDVDNSIPPQILLFSSGGGVSDWPRGFFDQYQMDVAALTRIRRRR